MSRGGSLLLPSFWSVILTPSLEVDFSVVVVIEFPVESGVLNTLFGSVEKIEVEKDSGVSWSVMTPVGDGGFR
ncbi:hypothetical protein F2Q70_00000099 [Brassica cretica]|uniref:Uncharacterized protein n=1 Tax=Brassica cretica TaxID=69181 RepID=A0A3N6QC49_BRACR|nr:hypothetical protein F2Q70_00000099 [Brassica cretica]KAF3563695.1 hypothetical protein DY000_02010852 [Brassica cretica]